MSVHVCKTQAESCAFDHSELVIEYASRREWCHITAQLGINMPIIQGQILAADTWTKYDHLVLRLLSDNATWTPQHTLVCYSTPRNLQRFINKYVRIILHHSVCSSLGGYFYWWLLTKRLLGDREHQLCRAMSPSPTRTPSRLSPTFLPSQTIPKCKLNLILTCKRHKISLMHRYPYASLITHFHRPKTYASQLAKRHSIIDHFKWIIKK